MDGLSGLWKKRRNAHFQRALRYWNLIGKNSGLMFFLYAMVIISGFYYRRWLESLPQNFPGVLLVSVILALVAVRSPIRTFLVKADAVFLLPVEAELLSYFRSSRLYSFSFQGITLVLIQIICWPLYQYTAGRNGVPFLLVAATVLAVKAWNIDSHWQEQFIRDTKPLKVIRSGLSFLLIYGAAGGLPAVSTFICAGIMFAVSVLLFHRQASYGLLDWSRLIDMDNRQELQFLRFVNLFTDVPRLRHAVHSRRLISAFFPIRALHSDRIYPQLFIKTWIRSDDYFAQYLRLTVIGMLACYFLNNGIYTGFVVVSVIYLTGLQLLPLWSHPFPQALEGLYPVYGALKKQSFIHLVFLLLVVQTVLLSIAGAAGHEQIVYLPAFLAAGGIVSLLFAYVYTAHRISSQN
jgi:Predicted ABC-type exoprotein transport system, permease component